ncbi:hypothetical protein DY000_02054592 [Brassica cretica]|uniref:NB-ARC domain-containing protein n=1 Tax=Brassica cretica TaxID=69181 RepID=A0ABQ7ACZ1_BRACR|nr:hypothetical protein DY000_02054592 [Brassica cretica]
MNARNGLRRHERCKDWISKIEAIQPKVTKLLEDKTAEIERLSMCGYCSTNFFLTYCYGKDVLETLEEVQSLLSSKPSGEVVRTGLPPRIEEIATEPTVGLEKMLETTWSRLMEKDVGILGLYGMGGVGKSTLLEKINQKLVEKKNEFEVVIFVWVSRDLQVEKIQNAIGERLGICDEAWKKKTHSHKTSRLYNVLAKRRFVMLLDDIWEKMDLKKIGIPLPSQENGSKVVFTTRSKDVCARMRSHHVLEVKKLDEENAWELFRRNFRGNNTLSDPEILKLARQLCEKCEGLPLALNVIGETMAYKTSVPEWQCAIDDLDSNAGGYPEVEDEILKILKFSYDDLKDERVKQCFQYCALFPQDAGIDKDKEGGGYGSISHATAHAQSGMTIGADKDKQTHDGTSVNANVERTPAGNVATVTTNAVILDQMKEMFASAQKKSDEQGKLVASLAKQVETLTEKAKSKNPRGATRTRIGRRLDFETPSDRATRADKDSSGQNPDETVPPGAQPTVENLPPPAGSNEVGDFERIDMDISDQSDHSDGGADVHPRRTRS